MGVVSLVGNLAAVSKCVLRNSPLPPESAQRVASTLKTFLEGDYSTEARCVTNCKCLTNGEDIKKIQQEFILVRQRQDFWFMFIVVVLAIFTLLFSMFYSKLLL